MDAAKYAHRKCVRNTVNIKKILVGALAAIALFAGRGRYSGWRRRAVSHVFANLLSDVNAGL